MMTGLGLGLGLGSLGWLETQHTPDDVCFYAPNLKAGDQSDLPFYRYHNWANPHSPCCGNGAQFNVNMMKNKTHET